MRIFMLPLVIMALLAGHPLPAAAQSNNPTSVQASQTNSVGASSLDRHEGFMIAFSLGGGSVRNGACQTCDGFGAVGVDGSVGWFLNQRVALMYDAFALATASTIDVNDIAVGETRLESTANAMGSLAVQYWLTPAFWVKGGLGYARLLRATPFGTGEQGGGGVTLGAGYELLRGRGNFVLDVRGLLSHADIVDVPLDSVAVLIGFSWY